MAVQDKSLHSGDRRTNGRIDKRKNIKKIENPGVDPPLLGPAINQKFQPKQIVKTIQRKIRLLVLHYRPFPLQP